MTLVRRARRAPLAAVCALALGPCGSSPTRTSEPVSTLSQGSGHDGMTVPHEPAGEAPPTVS
jgi:hypothetical protein